MIRAFLIALFLAAFIHGAVLLFGGVFKFLLVKKEDMKEEDVRQVEIVEESKKEDEKPEEKETKKVDRVEETPEDQMPDTTVLEQAQQQKPALTASSLSDLESALSGISGGGDFGGGASFASGGVIGGTGKPGSGGDIDAIMGGGGGDGGKPRLLSSPKPNFPVAAIKKGGAITLLIHVGADGKVMNVAVDQATDASLEKPALDAVRKWTFTPATRGGKKVPAKVKQTIQLSPKNA